VGRPRVPASARRPPSSSPQTPNPDPVAPGGPGALDPAWPEGAGAADTTLLAEPAWVVGARFLVYTLAILGCTLSLPLLVGSDGDIAAFDENGAIEWTQWTLLAGSALLLFAMAAQRTHLGQSAVPRDDKRVIEETSELVGYALIVIGSIELLWQERRQAGV